MKDRSEFICAYKFDGKGAGHPLQEEDLLSWTPEKGKIWLHLDCLNEQTEVWLREESKLDTYVIDGLLASETRPRCDEFDDGVLIVLRGVNLNPGEDAEDMVSIRIWVEENRIISTRIRKLMAVSDIRNQFEKGNGPLSPGHFIARLSYCLTERMAPVIEGLGDQVAELEQNLTEGGPDLNLREVRQKLTQVRRVAITLRRYVAPQRDAIGRLLQFDLVWLNDPIKGRLRETWDRVTRMIEELDEVRERSTVVQDEIGNRISQRMEQTMYVLTVVATIMLPLGFLTGLLGINVGGIPGTETSWAFWAVCVLLTVIVGVEMWLFRKLRWL